MDRDCTPRNPRHEQETIQRRSNGEKVDVSIVIPAFNEEDRIGRTLASLNNWLNGKHLNSELIVVDDGSVDSTSSRVRAFQSDRIRLIRLARNSGKGEALRQGTMASEGAWVFWVDADLPYSGSFLEEALALLREGGQDAVIGARDLPDSHTDQSYPRRRVVAGRLFSNLVNLLLPLRIFDTQCGIKGFRGGLVRSATGLALQSDYTIDIEVLLLLRLWTCRIVRIPVRLINHHGSRVRLLRDSLKMFISLLRITWRLKRGDYPSQPPREGLTVTVCPVCEHSAETVLRNDPDLRFCRCGSCRTLFQNPRPEEAKLGHLYGPEYFRTADVRSGYPDYYETLEEQRQTAEWIWARLESFAPIGRVLDVGSGSGQFLRVALEKGIEAWGIDPVRPNQEIDYHFVPGSFPHPDLPVAHFDALVFNDSFEHFPRPGPVLSGASRSLRPGGLIVVNTPDPQSIIARLSGARWISFKREHLVIYPRFILGQILSEAGFVPIARFASRQKVSREYLVPRLLSSGLPGFLARPIGRLLPAQLWVPTSGMIVLARKQGSPRKLGSPPSAPPE